MTKEEKLIKLYEDCIKNNYTDMSDETQQLKVKVFAMDLKLRYKNIVDLYNEAKEVYENAERIKAEEAVVGEKILILTDADKVTYYIYKRPNGSVYCRRDNDNKKCSFSFEASRKQVLNSTYHPSQTIYTGASSGGVSMGGVHQTEAYYTESLSSTNKGEVILIYEGERFSLKEITVPAEIGKLYKHDKCYASRFVGNKAQCRLRPDKFQNGMYSATMSGGYADLSMASYLSSELCLELSVCQELVAFLYRVCNGEIPEQDEDIYIRAKKLAESEKLSDLIASKELFGKIPYYKDSVTLRKNLTGKITEAKKREEERIQLEKERLVLQKEAQAKTNKKLAVIIPSIIAVVVVFAIIMTTVIIPSNKYNKALNLMNENEYVKAAAIFFELIDFKDSKEQLSEAMKKISVKETISSGGYHTVGLKSDGTVVATGYLGDSEDYDGECDVFDWTDIVAISAGSSHTVGLKSDGTVVATEYTGNSKWYGGQCDVSDWTDIVAISAGDSYTVGLKADGTVVAVGSDVYDRCDVDEWTGIVAISTSVGHTVGLKSDGTVVAIGDNEHGECNVAYWTDIVAISAGEWHTVGLKSDGTVVAVGYEKDGRYNVAGWTDIVAISAGDSQIVGLKSDGTVVAVGNNMDGQCDVEDWTDIVAISAGKYHTVGLKSDGTVVAVGSDYAGRCDVSGWKNIKVPEKK